jgi:drug/metabolite transporter (DMT)-like permease
MPPGPAPGKAWLTDALVLVVAVVWGSSYLVTKEITAQDTVIALLLLRFLIAVPVLGLATWRRARRLVSTEVRGGVVLGVVLTVIFLLETYGVVHTSATNAGLIISLTMIFTPLAEMTLGRGSFNARFVQAAAVSVLGVGLLTQDGGFTAPSAGDVLMLLAAVARTVHVLFMHRLPAIRETDDGALTLVQLSTTVLGFALLSRFTGATPWQLARDLTGMQWMYLVYLALMCTVFAFLVQLWAVRRTTPSRVSLLLGTEPLWAVLVGTALGGDRLGVVGGLGAALVLLGTFWGRRVADAATVAAADDPGEREVAAEVQA